jgi:1,2-diacylglycerol 3-alpha-glucosyltransferase
MKILMICDYFHEMEQYQENSLAKYYLKLGHSVTIIASTSTSLFHSKNDAIKFSSSASEYSYSGIKIYRLPYVFNIFNKVYKYKKIQKYIKHISPDFIFIHTISLKIIDVIVYKKTHPNTRIVIDSHADYSNSGNSILSKLILHKTLYKITIRFSLKYMDKVFFVTPQTGEFLTKMYHIPSKHMQLLPLGVDNDLANDIRSSDARNRIRSELSIPVNSFIVFTGGKITKEKKTWMLIQAIKKNGNPDIHLVIVGRAQNENYEREIRNLTVSHKNLHYIGWVDGKDVYSYLAASDIAVFPASQSVLWQQSIGMGLPLIVGELPNQDATYLNKNANIIIIKSDDVSASSLEKQIETLFQDKILIKSMSGNALKTTEEMLSYENISLLSINEHSI